LIALRRILSLNRQMVEWLNSQFIEPFKPSTIIENKNRI